MNMSSVRVALVTGACLMVLPLAACQKSAAAKPVDVAAEAEALKSMDVAWSAEIAAKDVEKQVAHYTPDAVVVTPEGVMRGAAEVRAGMGAMLGDPAFKLSFRPDRAVVARSGELGYTSGGYTVTYTDPATKKPMSAEGVYVTVYTKGPDGRWKAAFDMAENTPVMAAASKT
jgi:ketosteroid isomerase-like protein